MTAIPLAPAYTPLFAPASLAPEHSPRPLTAQPAEPANDSDADEFDNPTALNNAFAERHNWQTLSQALHKVLESLEQASHGDMSSEQKSQLEATLASHLNTVSISVCEDSSYYRKHKLTPTSLVKLEVFLSGSGLTPPKTLDDLLALYQVAVKQAHSHPLGNFSGALAWPIPLNAQQKQTIIDLLNAPHATVPGLPLADKKKGVLGYLLSAANLSNADLKQTSNAVETLLGSANAQALGRAIQTKLGGIATTSSINDYLLAAIHLGLDSTITSEPTRTNVAEFDLNQRAFWGKSAPAIIDGLSQYLVTQGLATAPSADLAARVLLARTAPQCLVKDIPPGVTYGSIPWAQLAIAAAKLEAQSPGCVLTMTYAQVIAAAEDLDIGAVLTHAIQREALRNWGVANELLKADPVPTETQMLAVQSTFMAQQSALQATSTALATPIPMCEEMGMALLKSEFPGIADDVFRSKCLTKATLSPGRPGRSPGKHSMLDVVMRGEKVNHGDKEHWLTDDKRIPIEAFCIASAGGKLSVAEPFAENYKQAIEAQEKGHAGLTRYLISTLPPEDRKNFEYGQLEFFRTNQYKIENDFWNKTLYRKDHTLDVKITRDKQVNLYRIDTLAGTVSKHNDLLKKYTPPYKELERRDANLLSKLEEFNPFADEHATQAPEKKPTTSDTPRVFDSERSAYIAKLVVNALDLQSEDLRNYARGMTSYDKDAADNKRLRELFLNMIPLRSAIVNFMQGKIGDGLFDLATDVVGLVTLGAGKVAQAGRVFAKGVSGVKGVARTARFLGTVAIQALNPLDGAGDLLKGISRWTLSKARKAVSVLKGANGSYDALKAAGTQHGLAAIGIYKVADQHVEAGAVFRNGHWHAYDVIKQQPYGAPLDHFQPTVATLGGEVKALDTPSLLDYKVNVTPEQLRVTGLQNNIYVGPNNKEYIKIDNAFYASKIKDGQRVIQHPSAARNTIPVKDLGNAGWEPSATASRLFGGSPPSPWKLNDTTYVVPVDDIKIHTDSPYPYTINYQGMNYVTTFDTQVGAWRAGSGTGNGTATEYFWRTAKNKWQRGPLQEYINAKKHIAEHNFRFIEITPPAILQMPKNIRPIPKDIHYFWAGGEIPDKLAKNIANNAEKMPGFKSIVHVDADDAQTFQAIKLKLENNASGITVMNLHEDAFFEPLKNSELYTYFRQGQGKNLAATSDVTRYPLMNKYGGIYLDTDDTIRGTVGSAGLNAGDSDMLVSRPVAHRVTDFKPFFNTSNFATQPNNPVVTEMIAEMNRRFTKNKAYFETNRPTLSRNTTGGFAYTSDFLEYEGKVFETVGPTLFDDVLKAKRPDIYYAGFDGLNNKKMQQADSRFPQGEAFNLESDTRQYYANQGLTAPEGLKQSVDEAKKHYSQFRTQLQIDIGAEHSWIDS